MTTHGGATDFACLIKVCEMFGPYCLIGGLSVNCYVEPVYILDADLVVVASSLSALAAHFRGQGFEVDDHPHSFNVLAPSSKLRIHFMADDRYQAFLARAIEAEVLGLRVKVASLEDVTRGKLWAYADPRRPFSERKKDELDLIRLAESYPAVRSLFPDELNQLIDRA